MGGLASVRRRLEQCGGEMTVEQFRAEQVIWAVSAGRCARLWKDCPVIPFRDRDAERATGRPVLAPPESARRLVLLRHGRTVDNFTGVRRA